MHTKIHAHMHTKITSRLSHTKNNHNHTSTHTYTHITELDKPRSSRTQSHKHTSTYTYIKIQARTHISTITITQVHIHTHIPENGVTIGTARVYGTLSSELDKPSVALTQQLTHWLVVKLTECLRKERMHFAKPRVWKNKKRGESINMRKKEYNTKTTTTCVIKLIVCMHVRIVGLQKKRE